MRHGRRYWKGCRVADNTYCYPGTEVLKNKLDIRNQDKLADIERQLTMLRLEELIIHPVSGNFDLMHMQRIHKYIFQDIYDWAGRLRTVNIAKGNMFCDVRFIREQAADIFGNLRNENYLMGLEKTQYVNKLAYYFSEINALHPFREGNGRTQREFIRCLAFKNSYAVHFESVSSKEMLAASKASFLCDYDSMVSLFDRCLIKVY